jgi:hypothetical protein
VAPTRYAPWFFAQATFFGNSITPLKQSKSSTFGNDAKVLPENRPEHRRNR